MIFLMFRPSLVDCRMRLAGSLPIALATDCLLSPSCIAHAACQASSCSSDSIRVASSFTRAIRSHMPVASAILSRCFVISDVIVLRISVMELLSIAAFSGSRRRFSSPLRSAARWSRDSLRVSVVVGFSMENMVVKSLDNLIVSNDLTT